MKQLQLFTLLVSLIFISAAWSVAVPVHNFDCKTCHLADKAFVDLDGNICLSCHGTGLNLKASAGFASGDASNQYGNNPAPGDETSHHWAATSTNPAAGASEPYSYPGFYSNYGTSVGKVSCSRCHQPHGDQTINPNLLTTTASGYRAFTAAPLTPDQMCLACHAQWNQTDNHGWLTHPLVADYNAAVFDEPDKYKATLDNSHNAAIQLVDGGVSCTSCHGVHFVDSDSATTDGPTGLLSQSDGKLLRGDGPERADKSSLCQTCHTHKKHGKETGEMIGCLVCHSGHSYDPDFPNYYVLRKTVNTATFGLVENLNYITADASWNDVGGTEGYCEKCHGDAGAIEIVAGTYHPADANCKQCHNHSGSNRGSFSPDCLGCHSVAQGDRAAISGQFSSNSHHIQGITVTTEHCYQCHWEANSDGSVNDAYHAGGAYLPGDPVNLVIYGAGTRPTDYAVDTSAIEYQADGSRTEIVKLNSHCLSCHSDHNSATQPFGDGKTPQTYAWDGTSIDNRYSQFDPVTDKTVWGKYSGVSNAAKKDQTKAYSAHGNAITNQGGWSSGPAGSGIDADLPNTRNGTVNITCYDCHNSHGSSVSGKTTSYISATVNGGLLKDTQSGKGGYNVSYRPVAGGSSAQKNEYNPGAGLCFDCHLNENGSGSQPWGYNSTFGATQKILGYYDAPDFSTIGSGSHGRFPYKADTGHMGGHFGASNLLESPVSEENQINGLCTPCHDPHGVSPSLGSNQQYGVPLLKGTWLSSPYKEDVAPASSGAQTAAPQGTPRDYHLDQNTFGGNIMQIINWAVNGIQQEDAQFAGLCLRCHPKQNLTDGVTHTWKSKDRIHESVKGWKTSPGQVKHQYSCSKCHAPHGGTGLPRLMITNCLDWTHKGRVAYGTPTIQNAYEDVGGGQGKHPGSYDYYDAWYGPEHWEPRGASLAASCHEGNTGIWSNQRWNEVTPWSDAPILSISSAPVATGFASSANPQVKATISWGTNLLSDSTVDFGLTTSYGQTVTDSSATISHALVLDGLKNHNIYHYKVRSSTYGGQQATSGDRTFTINVGPNKPTRIDRLDKSCPGGGCSATVAWNPTTDPDGGPVWYEIEYDTSATFDTPNKASTGWLPGTVAGSSLTADIGPLYTDTLYYWHVRARDNNHPGAISEWSTFDSFRTLPDYLPPSVPSLKYDGNATNCGTRDNPECSKNLRWRVSTTSDPDLGPIEYYLEIDSDPGFASAEKQVVDYPAGTFGGYYMETLVGPLATDTTWYWRVKARYTDPVTRESDFSGTATFDTIFPVPYWPKNLDSSPNPVLCEGEPCPSVLLSWESSGAWAGGDVKHFVEIDSVSNFSSTDKQSFGPLDVGITSQLVDNLDKDKTWYWHVRAQDAIYTKSLTNWVSGTPFETMTFPAPTTPTALFTSDVVSPDLATLTWTPSTTYNGGTVEYTVEVDDDPGFTSIDASVSGISGTSWSPGSIGTGIWYWRVLAEDIDHITAQPEWSNTGMFRIWATTPASRTITFYWADAPPDSINIDGTLYGGTGNVSVTITTSFTAEIVGAPGQVGGGEPDADWEYYANQAPGGNPGYISAVFTPNDGNEFTVKVGSTPAYRSWGGLGGGASYVAKDDSTIMYAAGGGGGGGGEASFYWPWPEDYDWYGDDGVDGEDFGSAQGGAGGAGSTSLSGPGAAGSPGGNGSSGYLGVSPTTFTGSMTTPRVTITLQ